MESNHLALLKKDLHCKSNDAKPNSVPTSYKGNFTQRFEHIKQKNDWLPWLPEICFWREAPEAGVGPDRRAGKGC